MSSSPGFKFSKGLFGALISVGFIFLLFVGLLATESSTLTTRSLRSFKHMEAIGTEKLLVYPDLDLNYMSKRRIPNGPDPIHNRRAGNSKRPPGQA